MDKKNKILNLFICFFRIGLFTFGGGYAMIPLIQREVVENKKWLTDAEILDVISISESTPGPIAINAATFVGYKVCGFWGAFFSTLGVVMPSFLIITAISFVLNKFSSLKAVKYAFAGIRAGVLALIVKALYSMYKQSPKGVISYIIMLLAFVCAALIKVNVLYIIITSAILGLVYSLLAERRIGR